MAKNFINVLARVLKKRGTQSMEGVYDRLFSTTHIGKILQQHKGAVNVGTDILAAFFGGLGGRGGPIGKAVVEILEDGLSEIAKRAGKGSKEGVREKSGGMVELGLIIASRFSDWASLLKKVKAIPESRRKVFVQTLSGFKPNYKLAEANLNSANEEQLFAFLEIISFLQKEEGEKPEVKKGDRNENGVKRVVEQIEVIFEKTKVEVVRVPDKLKEFNAQLREKLGLESSSISITQADVKSLEPADRDREKENSWDPFWKTDISNWRR